MNKNERELDEGGKNCDSDSHDNDFYCDYDYYDYDWLDAECIIKQSSLEKFEICVMVKEALLPIYINHQDVDVALSVFHNALSLCGLLYILCSQN